MGKTARLASIDMLRGFVIALMALDHARDFFAPADFHPEDLAHTTPAWFWTRWITHLCATTFVLLAGSSAFLRGEKTGLTELARYLATRGLILLALECTWISFCWQFGVHVIILQVIYAIGMSMIFLAVLLQLPRALIGAVGALLILSHNLFDAWKHGDVFWQLWHQGGFIPFPKGWLLEGVVVMYPLMPWLGLMALGYAMGPIFHWEAGRRQRALWLGAALLAIVFVLLRMNNLYGDPDPWSAQGKGWMFDVMSFMRVHKYPPSLLYLCSTGALSLALLAAFERVRPVPLLMLFGATPMFFYVTHIALTHFLGNLYFEAMYPVPPSYGPNGFIAPPGYQPSLLLTYGAWLCMLALMYGLTRLWLRYRPRT